MVKTLDQVDTTVEHTVSADVLVKARCGLSLFIALMTGQLNEQQAAMLAMNFGWTPKNLLEAVDALDAVLDIEQPEDVTPEQLSDLLYESTGVRN